jgi:hypothetical protein
MSLFIMLWNVSLSLHSEGEPRSDVFLKYPSMVYALEGVEYQVCCSKGG